MSGMKFDFDLETCQVELERVRDLLTIVIEFFGRGAARKARV